MQKIIIIILSVLFFSFAFCNDKNPYYTEHNYIPRDGYVPDSSTAKKIAEVIWFPIYGEEINNFKPFVAHLKDSTVWVVEGQLKGEIEGGSPYIEIRKSDCKIIKVSFGK